MSQVIIKYTDESGESHTKDSIQMDARLFINFVYAVALIKGWRINSVASFVLG